MYILFAIPLAFILLAFIAGLFVSAPGYKGPKSDHFNGTTFQNYDGAKAKGIFNVLKWMAKRHQGVWQRIEEIETAKPHPSEEKLTIYFINHASFLIQWQGLNILTDPVLSRRVSPFTFVGPERMQPPGIILDDLPKIDLILLSHNHYDHLDLPFLKKINKRDCPKLIVPLGVNIYLKNKNIKNITSLDWWHHAEFKDLTFELVPAQHFSGRGMLDRDKTLWGGYMINSGSDKLYFVGDTGYNERMFDDILLKHKNITVAIIPIGAYEPRWFMSPIHISPEEAVKLHIKIKPAVSIGMHYGTFPLADEGQSDAQEELKEALSQKGINDNSFLLLKEGKKFILQ